MLFFSLYGHNNEICFPMEILKMRKPSSLVTHHVHLGSREAGSWSGTRRASNATITYYLCVTSVTRDSVTWKWKSYTLRKGGAPHHQWGYLMFDLTCATLNVAMLRMIGIWMICKCNCLLSKTAVFGEEIFLQTTYGFATLVWGVSSLRPVQPKGQNFALVPAWQYAQSFQSCQTPQRTVGQVRGPSWPSCWCCKVGG